MAEDTREIVYYRGRDYRVKSRGEKVSEITNGVTTILIETSNLLTPAEYELKKANRRSEHVNWTK